MTIRRSRKPWFPAGPALRRRRVAHRDGVVVDRGRSWSIGPNQWLPSDQTGDHMTAIAHGSSSRCSCPSATPWIRDRVPSRAGFCAATAFAATTATFDDQLLSACRVASAPCVYHGSTVHTSQLVYNLARNAWIRAEQMHPPEIMGTEGVASIVVEPPDPRVSSAVQVGGVLCGVHVENRPPESVARVHFRMEGLELAPLAPKHMTLRQLHPDPRPVAPGC